MLTKRSFKNSIYLTIRLIFKGLAKVLFKFEVRGVEHIPRTGAAIITSNHASNLDPPLIGMAIPRPIFYFAKEELFRTLFGSALRMVNAIPVNRDQLDRKTLRAVLGVLAQGEMIVMFPEGTRTETGDLQAGKPGTGFIAYHAKVPVIPAYISGSFEILPRGGKFIHLKKCIVTFGPAVDFEQFFAAARTKDMYERMSREIMRSIAQLSGLHGHSG
jgi:1-acyl-sn-glycerol-3-phosphate acyltransferase